MTRLSPGPSASRPRSPAERIAGLVERCPAAPRPVAWWALAESVLSSGVAAMAFLLALLFAFAVGVTGVMALGVAAAVGGAAVALGLLVDLARLVRLGRIARHGVLVTATVTDDPPQPARNGQRRARRVAHPRGQVICDRMRVPSGAPQGAFAQSVLVAPDRPEVWLTLTIDQPLDAAAGPARQALTGRAPLIAATGWGRATAAWRAGLVPLVAGIILAQTVAQATGQTAGWLVALAGPAVWVLAARRVGLRADQHGVVLRSALWTRSRSWDRLERLTRGEVVILAGKYGSAWTASVLSFQDDLGVRLKAVATVRCWDQLWLAELVRRCEAAGLTVDDEVAPAHGDRPAGSGW